MFLAALCGILSLVIMCISAFVANPFGSMVVFVLGLLLLAASLWAYCEERFGHSAGHWPGR